MRNIMMGLLVLLTISISGAFGTEEPKPISGAATVTVEGEAPAAEVVDETARKAAGTAQEGADTANVIAADAHGRINTLQRSLDSVNAELARLQRLRRPTPAQRARIRVLRGADSGLRRNLAAIERRVAYLERNPLGGTPESHRKVYNNLSSVGFITRGEADRRYVRAGAAAVPATPSPAVPAPATTATTAPAGASGGNMFNISPFAAGLILAGIIAAIALLAWYIRGQQVTHRSYDEVLATTYHHWDGRPNRKGGQKRYLGATFIAPVPGGGVVRGTIREEWNNKTP